MAPSKHFTGLRPLIPTTLPQVSAQLSQNRAALVTKLRPLILESEVPSNGAPSLVKLWPDLQQATWRLLVVAMLPRSLPNMQLVAEKFDGVAGVIAVRGLVVFISFGWLSPTAGGEPDSPEQGSELGRPRLDAGGHLRPSFASWIPQR